MILIYNGIQLPLTRVTLFEQKPVYSDDGADVLYYHFRLGAETVFNPGVFAANWFNQSRSIVTPLSAVSAANPFGSFSPELQGGQPNFEMPAASIARLRQALLHPRRLLVLQDDRGAVVLESPIVLGQGQFAGGYTRPGQTGPPQQTPRRAKTDCCNGPKPITFNVLSWEASQTARCYFEIETWIKECPPLYSRRNDYTTGGYTNPNIGTGGYTNPNIVEGGAGAGAAAGGTATSPGQSAVISHRWEESHSVNDLGWTTRIIAGQIRFRKDILIETGLEPDDFRLRLFPRIPLGFLRHIDGVGTSSDGLTCYYKVTDTQEPRSLIGRFQQYRFRGNFNAGFDNSSGVLPMRFAQLHLEIWGQPSITTVQGATQNIRQTMVNDLFTLANQLVDFGGGNLAVPALGRFHGTQVWVDLYERHATLDSKWALGGVSALIEEVAPAVINFVNRTNPFARAGIVQLPQVPTTLTLLQRVERALQNNNAMTDVNVDSTTNPPPSRGPLSRGPYAGIIVAQALKATCETPAETSARPENRRARITNSGTGNVANWNQFGVPNRTSDPIANRGSVNNEAGY